MLSKNSDLLLGDVLLHPSVLPDLLDRQSFHWVFLQDTFQQVDRVFRNLLCVVRFTFNHLLLKLL